MTITRSKERIKRTSEIFTPIPLIQEILDRLPPEVWQDHSKTSIDNSCGVGNFLLCVVGRKMENGSTVKQALETTYGVDRGQRDRLLNTSRHLGISASADNGFFSCSRAQELMRRPISTVLHEFRPDF